jgi:MFS family permease
MVEAGGTGYIMYNLIMLHFFRSFLPFHRFKYSNKAIKVLTLSDTLFFSGMALTEIVFSVFIITQITGSTVVNLGVGNALFMAGVLLAEPLFSKFYDSSKDITTSFYGFVIGNMLKSVFRILFVFINSVNMFYVVYFLLGIVHSVEYPSFAKLFSRYIDKGLESSEWGYKDVFISLGKIITLFLSGYIVVLFGYNTLFMLSAIIMFLSGVVLPLMYKKELTS